MGCATGARDRMSPTEDDRRFDTGARDGMSPIEDDRCFVVVVVVVVVVGVRPVKTTRGALVGRAIGIAVVVGYDEDDRRPFR